MHFYSKDEINYLRKISQGRTNKQITKMFNKKFNLNISEKALSAVRIRNDIKTGADGRFIKGNIPSNKGKKGSGGWEPTQFKKGHIPPNRLPIGTERVDSKNGYVLVKIQDGKLNKNWKLKHVLIWEEHNGPVPKGHNVIFGDRNNRNFDINNLVVVSKQQMLMLNRNNLIQNNVELTKSAIILADLMTKTSQRGRSKDGQSK